MLLWLTFVIFSIFLYVKLTEPLYYWKRKNAPYIPGIPIIGNFYEFWFRLKTMAECVQDMYNYERQTRYIGFVQMKAPILMIRDLNLIKQIGIKEFDHFVDHRQLLSDDLDPLFSKNLFSLSGTKWRHMRSTLSPAFTSSKMRSMFVLISECAEQFTNHFTKIVDPSQPYTLEMKDAFTRFANDVIATTAFGIQCDSLKEENNEFYLMGKDATNFSGWRALKFIGFNISPKLMKMLKTQIFSQEVSKFFRGLVKSNISEREKNGIVRPDMIHLLMEARKGKLSHDESSKHKDDGAGFATVEESDIGKEVRQTKPDLSDDDITAQALIFFFAGFDTISSALCHMSYELALNPEIQEHLQEEVDATWEDCNGKLTYEVVLKMKYLDMVLCETLRKWPALATLDRQCTETYTIQPETENEHPITLHKGDMVWFPVFALHRDPQYWPEPEKFDPERFSDENKESIHPMSYIPFGVGPRNCIASRFALMEAKTMFVYLLRKFSFEIVAKSQVPLKIKKGQMNMNAENGFWLGLKLRHNK